MVRKRLDKVMVARGLAVNTDDAAQKIAASMVRVAGMLATSPSSQVDVNVALSVSDPQADSEYVSRGAHKLIAGLDTFAIDPRGWVALDIGASTGGFTDVLLRRGAAKVYAIDVGYGQLAWPLRNDPRVVVLERHNVRNMQTDHVPGGADLAVIDASFISLTAILPSVATLLGGSRRPIIALVKPQFEVAKADIAPGGVVTSEAARLGAIEKVSNWAQVNGFAVGAHTTSPITGPAGNIEYLLLLHTP